MSQRAAIRWLVRIRVPSSHGSRFSSFHTGIRKKCFDVQSRGNFSSVTSAQVTFVHRSQWSFAVIFFLTSLFIDSRFQSVATEDRRVSMKNGKGE